MKRILMSVLIMACAMTLFAGGGGEKANSDGKLELRVVTSYSATDGNRVPFEKAYKAWEAASGNAVIDESQTSDETWKAKVLADFETGSEPDVLFFFTGTDANSFIEAGKVVSLEEIRSVYPDYASNMSDGKLAGAASLVDNKVYAIPTNGFWEGLFVNTAILAEAGAAVPGPNTTWAEFLDICQKVKDAGYTPIALSLNHIPHYWFEFAIMNNGGPAAHLNVPKAVNDPAYKAWAAGLNDIRDLYQRGFLPANTLSASDDETFQGFYDGNSAFAIDGSWKVGGIVDNVGDRLADYGVTFVPGKGPRKSTDIIGGLSMGYYITKKAWNDPARRDAAVDFVRALTSDAVVNEMAAGTSVTALAKTAPKPTGFNSLQESAFEMMQAATSVVPAVQDIITPEAKAQILETDTKMVASNAITAETAVNNMMAVNK
ncbi:MAG: extracellular solute-binding protein [Treponema sp.]|jgi:raffinose/stachyose/melibiose transport system substrate-binding protein|nr:extracellular solute-binding protein [Treponema sp.]